MTESGNELRDFFWMLRRVLYMVVRYIEGRYGAGPAASQTDERAARRSTARNAPGR